ncbi:MAG: FeoB-associated Cys-rich membrane protein [Lachnospiraceae bacterium]|nr:FeoB-associated Cys-rich membrane protein [Lachnospiraceae bacterium]
MTDFIVIGIVLIIVGVAIAYIVKEKKNGVKCIGCPAGGNCSGKCAGNSGSCNSCHSDTLEEK